jgi:hypothetical protein
MPVRKIPKNYLTVTGSFASRKNGHMDAFESLLEKEFMLLLEFDETVSQFEPQPVTIAMTDVVRGYTPDVLVYFHPDVETGKNLKPQLVEVKHTDDLTRNAEKYAPKFAAAEKFAAEREWEFCVKTQVDIRIQRLINIKFLREYRNIEPLKDDCTKLFQLVSHLGGASSVNELLAKLALTDDERLYWIPIIWHAAVTRSLVCDWDQPINNDTTLYSSEDVL